MSATDIRSKGVLNYLDLSQNLNIYIYGAFRFRPYKSIADTFILWPRSVQFSDLKIQIFRMRRRSISCEITDNGILFA